MKLQKIRLDLAVFDEDTGRDSVITVTGFVVPKTSGALVVTPPVDEAAYHRAAHWSITHRYSTRVLFTSRKPVKKVFRLAQDLWKRLGIYNREVWSDRLATGEDISAAISYEAKAMIQEHLFAEKLARM